MSAALVVAHPGHELRIHGWLERARPVVFALTDGSGRTGRSRLASTTRVLERAGAEPGFAYGRMSDVSLYAAIRRQDRELFAALAEELAAHFVSRGIGIVVADAEEGYNPGHDLCRWIADAAAARAGGLRCLDFALAAHPHACSPDLEEGAVWVELDEAALERKLAAARGYAELAGELEAALGRFGTEVFRRERLRPARSWLQTRREPEEAPYYERYGARRVAEGHYPEVIRWREHMRPIAERLRLLAE